MTMKEEKNTEIMIIENIKDGRWFFYHKHSSCALGEDWVPTTFTLPMEVEPRPGLEDGIIDCPDQLASVFFDPDKEITPENPVAKALFLSLEQARLSILLLGRMRGNDGDENDSWLQSQTEKSIAAIETLRAEVLGSLNKFSQDELMQMYEEATTGFSHIKHKMWEFGRTIPATTMNSLPWEMKIKPSTIQTLLHQGVCPTKSEQREAEEEEEDALEIY